LNDQIKTPLLDSVNAPADLRDFTVDQLKQVADELRNRMLEMHEGLKEK